MAVSGSMQTRVIISAEDRGISRLMRRLSGECDATIAKFGQLGNTLAGLTATFTAGFGIKKAIGWIDDMEKSVFSIATTLTDTLHGLSSDELSRAFDDNARHARAMYREFQQQAKRSIADVQELINAYQMFTNVGIAAPTNSMSAKQIDQLVTRVKLKTEGQNQMQQVFDEIRGILQGRTNVHAVVSSQFSAIDANYKETIKRLVSKGDWNEIFEYIMSLITDIPLESKIQNLLSTKLKIVQGDVKEWAIEAFMPMKEQFGRVLDGISKEFESEDSPFKKGITEVVARMTSMFERAANAMGRFLRTDAGKWFMELTPKILAMAGAVTSLTMAIAGLKAATGVFYTIPGMIMGAAMAYEGLNTYNSQTGAEFNGDWLSNKQTGEFDWDNFAKGVQDVIDKALDVLNRLSGIVLSFLKMIYDALMIGIKDILAGILGAADALMKLPTMLISMFQAELKYYGDNISLTFNSMWEQLKIVFEKAVLEIKDTIFKTWLWLKEVAYDLPVVGKKIKASDDENGGIEKQREEHDAIYNRSRAELAARAEANMSLSGFERIEKEHSLAYKAINDTLEENPTFMGVLGGELAAEAREYMNKLLEDRQKIFDNWYLTNVVKSKPRQDGSNGAEGNTNAIFQNRPNEVVALQQKDLIRQGKELEKTLAQTANLDKAIADIQKLLAKGGDEYSLEMANVNVTLERFRKAAQIAGAAEISYSEKLQEYLEFMRGDGEKNAKVKEQKEKELADLYKNQIDAANSSFAEKKALFNQVYEQLTPELNRQAMVKVADITEDKLSKLLATSLGSEYLDERNRLYDDRLDNNEEIRRLRQAKSGVPESYEEATRRRDENERAYQRQLDEMLRLAPRMQNYREASQIEGRLLEILGTSTGNFARDSRSEAMSNMIGGAAQLRKWTEFATGDVESETEVAERLAQTQQQYNNALREMMPLLQQQQQYYETINELMSGGHDIQAGILAGMQDYVESVGSVFSQVRDLAKGVINTISSSMSTLIYDYLIGDLKSFKEYFQSFCKSILKMVSDIISQVITQLAVIGIVKMITGAAVGGIVAGAGAGATNASTMAMNTKPVPLEGASVLMSANGNVLRGGFQAFANGGVVSKPTLGLIGEGRFNEAVVPLPDGRRIPVHLQSEQNGNASDGVDDIVRAINDVSVQIETISHKLVSVGGEGYVPPILERQLERQIEERTLQPSFVSVGGEGYVPPILERQNTSEVEPSGMSTEVVVNVIDNTNSGIQKNVSQSKDDLGRTVIDIVLDAVTRNKSGFRSQLRNQLQNA